MVDALRKAILRRIDDAGGRITFAEYMEMALYDEAHGFFASAPIGLGAHFVTSPHVSPVFGDLVAEQVRDTSRALSGDEPFVVVDLGAGDGTLAHQIAGIEVDETVIAVERAQPIAQDAGFEHRKVIEDLEPFSGLVVANELLDNVPFHRLRRREDGSVVEVFVGVRDDLLVEIEDSPTVRADQIPGARDWPVSLAAEQIVVTLAEKLRRGHAIFFDYGFVEGEPPEPIRGYKDQKLVHDLLAEPGATDITGPVNFSAIAAVARAKGFVTHGPITQREALMNLGYRAAVDAVRRQQTSLEQQGRHRDAVEMFGARNEAAMLVDPNGLGALKVLGLSTPGMPPPLAFR